MVLGWLVLARVHRATSGCVLVLLIRHLVLLIAGSLLQRFALLVIHLAVAVAWHDGALLGVVRDLVLMGTRQVVVLSALWHRTDAEVADGLLSRLVWRYLVVGSVLWVGLLHGL